jgi:hypothetical protein
VSFFILNFQFPCAELLNLFSLSCWLGNGRGGGFQLGPDNKHAKIKSNVHDNDHSEQKNAGK